MRWSGSIWLATLTRAGQIITSQVNSQHHVGDVSDPVMFPEILEKLYSTSETDMQASKWSLKGKQKPPQNMQEVVCWVNFIDFCVSLLMDFGNVMS